MEIIFVHLSEVEINCPRDKKRGKEIPGALARSRDAAAMRELGRCTGHGTGAGTVSDLGRTENFPDRRRPTRGSARGVAMPAEPQSIPKQRPRRQPCSGHGKVAEPGWAYAAALPPGLFGVGGDVSQDTLPLKRSACRRPTRLCSPPGLHRARSRLCPHILTQQLRLGGPATR